jgi:hypothetical protein
VAEDGRDIVAWEYMMVTADTRLPLGVLQPDVGELLYQVGREGWEAFAVTPPTPLTAAGDDEPGESVYTILLKRQVHR